MISLNIPMGDSHKLFIKTRHTLLSRLKNWEDSKSWKEFFEIYWGLIFNTALKMGCTEVEAEEVVQETMVAIAKNIKNFKCDPKAGSFKSWLMQQTCWKINDQLRKRRPNIVSINNPDNGLYDLSMEETLPDSNCKSMESIWNEEWENTILEAALNRIKQVVDPVQYQIFYLYSVKQEPVRKIAALFNINAGRVYLIKHRLGKLLKKEIKLLHNSPL
ncbi:MAG: sigma-70 family RNA polymerase sigma factor [Verrucomicrobiia bacterium]